ncbi:hypothetical protein [Eisenbergiella tayi]|nr:hypothetical protein [Eisenbergiella tayi]
MVIALQNSRVPLSVWQIPTSRQLWKWRCSLLTSDIFQLSPVRRSTGKLEGR